MPLENISQQFKNKLNADTERFSNKIDPFKTIHKATDRLSTGEKTLLAGAAGGAAGYYGSKALSNFIISLLFANKSYEERKELLERVSRDNRLNKLTALIGGAAAAYFAGGRDLKFDNWDNFKNSFKNREYLKSPEAYKKYTDNLNSSLRGEWYNSKTAGDNMYMEDNIPIKTSLRLVDEDLFLNPFEKSVTGSLIYGAENKDSGLTSGKKLTDSAIRAGVGFVPSYMFGKGVGTVLGLPAPIRDRISFAGGLAGAVINSGILKEIGA